MITLAVSTTHTAIGRIFILTQTTSDLMRELLVKSDELVDELCDELLN